MGLPLVAPSAGGVVVELLLPLLLSWCLLFFWVALVAASGVAGAARLL